MLRKDTIIMFSRNLKKITQFYASRMFNQKIHPGNYTTRHLYSTLYCRTKLKHPNKINLSYFPSSSFRTCVKNWNSEPCEERNHMIKLVFVKPDGEEIVLSGKAGQSVMEAAIQHEGIMQASCDGQLACTTCHVYVDSKIKDLFSETSLEEDDLLDNAPFCKPNSRLSCQLMLTTEMTEAKFGLPAATTNMSVDSNSGKSKNKDEEAKYS